MNRKVRISSSAHDSSRDASCFIYQIMKTREITILGKTLKVRFSLLSQIMFEQLSGKSFAELDTNSSKDRMVLYLAVLSSSNEGEMLTADELLKQCSLEDIRQIDQAVLSSMTEWSTIPAVIADKPTEPDAEKKRSSEALMSSMDSSSAK